MSKKMNLKRIIYLIGFIILIFCIIIGLGFIFEPKSNTKEAGMRIARARGFYGEPENSLDVVGIVNSDLYYAINPLWMYEDYGFTSYMAAEELQTTFQAYDLLKDILENQSPKLVVYEVNELFLRSGVFELGDLISHRINKLLPASEYHTRWKSLKSYDFKNEKQPLKTTTMKGFNYSLRQAEFKLSDYDDESTIDTMSRIDKYYLNKIMDLCESKGIKVIFLTTWAPADWSEARSEYVTKLAKQLGVDYYDFNTKEYQDLVGLDYTTDFMDYGNHMNLQGARKMTDWLGKTISETVKLEDKRKDSNYTAWDDCLKKFRKNVLKRAKKEKADIDWVKSIY